MKVFEKIKKFIKNTIIFEHSILENIILGVTILLIGLYISSYTHYLLEATGMERTIGFGIGILLVLVYGFFVEERMDDLFFNIVTVCAFGIMANNYFIIVLGGVSILIILLINVLHRIINIGVGNDE